jgi:hypothetical protein
MPPVMITAAPSLNQFGGKRRQPIEMPFRPAKLDGNVLS